MSGSTATKRTVKSLEQRLKDGEYVVCAEGYALELARMGYLTHGVWVPEVILEQPHILRNVHHQFVHAGSDVTEAMQFFTHRQKMRKIDREDDLEKINRAALKIAREVADETGTLMAGGISITNIYEENIKEKIRAMFEEQVCWSKEEGADYIIAETMKHYGEALIALEVIKSFNLPAVVSMTFINHYDNDEEPKTMDGIPMTEAYRKLLENGATLVGLNCYRGPDTALELIEKIVKKIPPEKLAVWPVCYRTTHEEQHFRELTDKYCPENNPVYPHGLDAFGVSPAEIVKFTKRCKELGLKYMGLCCGNSGNLTRAMAETLGKIPPASRYHDPSVPVIHPVKFREIMAANPKNIEA